MELTGRTKEDFEAFYLKGEQYMVFAEYVNTDYFKII